MSRVSGIAITGMACRLSGVSSLEPFWSNIVSGLDPFSPLPSSRFDSEIYAGELPGGKARVVLGALVEDFDLDWRALHMPPAQVKRLHRVERISLAVMGDALADAGILPANGPVERGSIWFGGSTIGPDPELDPAARIRRFELVAPMREALERLLPARAAEMGAVIERVSDLAAPPLEPDALMTSGCIIAGRASHLYDFRGGHLAVDVGNCSSMAAVSLAVRSLQNGACDVALVCAAAPLVTPSAVLAFVHSGYLAPDRPRPFSSNAAGTLLGDGAVAIVLQRAPEVAGKRTYAIIEGMGSSAAPGHSGGALARCVAEAAGRAFSQAEISPDDVEQIESRASGIAALDRAEAEGLAVAYRRTKGGQSAIVTSSVPSVGFLQSASGLLALVKASLALHHRCWPGQAALASVIEPVSGLRVPASATKWTGSRRAGVSDAGPDPIAYHAILFDPGAAQAPARPSRNDIHREPIAIVGAGIIAPGAADLEVFWRNTLARLEVFGDLPRSRWDVDRLIGSSAELARAFKTRLASTVDVPQLDSSRLHIPPKVAASMDPGSILAVGAVEQALGDAGFKPGAWPAHRVQIVLGHLALRTAEAEVEKRVQYALLAALAREAMREAGLSDSDAEAIARDARERFDRESRRFSEDTLSVFSNLTGAMCAAAVFGFSGELLTVDAACASSLAAVRIASDSLQSREADVVLAGGISYHLLPEYYIALGLLTALSTRAGRPFHRDADGFVPAEAAGAVVLKRLSDARAAKDRIYAIIRGHGASSDGRGLSIYSPSREGQQLAISRALSAAGLQASAIDVLEAHGPGAPLGDRTEMETIAKTYGERPFLPPLSIASAKSLIGHSSSAGAMVSLIRASLALASKVLPPSAGDGNLAPDLPFGPSLELSLTARPWTSPPGRARRAAVSAFGMTGVNHHLVLEEADAEPCREDIPRTALEHPATRPSRPLCAERFVLTESPVSLPDRPPLHPLRGRTIVVIPDRGSLCSEVEMVLYARGARPIRIELPPRASEADVRAALPVDLASLDGVLDLSAFGTEVEFSTLPSADLWSRLKSYSDRSFALIRVLYERFTSVQATPGCFVAVTSVGSCSNGPQTSAGNPLGAFFQGLARSLKQEIPGLLCKAIDSDPQASLSEVADAVVRETEDGNDRVDVRYSGRRFVTSYRRETFSNSSPVLRRLKAGDVFLFSGGGRGVVYKCATALAQLGLNVVVTGRRPLPDAALPWVNMTDAEFGEYRRAEIIRRRGTGTPAQTNRALDDLELQRQAHANIARAQAAGLSLHYEVCDITDPISVKGLVQRVRSRFGHIDGVGHGAMIEHSAIVPRKSPLTIDATLSTKVLGLANLLEATREDELAVFVAFGSGVGRYGNSGQTDYAASNALVATLLQSQRRSGSGRTHCVTIDWPAWESLGATANADVAELLRAAGVTSITPEEGAYWFLSELALGDAAEVVICGEGMLRSWPFLYCDADGKADRAVETDDEGAVLLPSRWPMIDRVVERAPQLLIAERHLSIERDLYLPEHLLNGRPVLPATFGCEMLAEAALLSCPGFYVQSIEKFDIEAPLTVLPGASVIARLIVKTLDATESRRVVAVEARTTVRGKGNAPLTDRLLQSARMVLTKSPPTLAEKVELPEGARAVHARSFFQLHNDPVYLGALFSRAYWIQVFENEAIGTLVSPDARGAFAEISDPRFVADPFLADAALQIAGSWDGYHNGFICVPLGVGTITLGRIRAPGERIRARARAIRVADPDVFYDIVVVGEDSDVLLKFSNVHARRIAGPVPMP